MPEQSKNPEQTTPASKAAKLSSTYAAAFATAVVTNATTLHARVLGESDGLKACDAAIRGGLVKAQDRQSAAYRLILDNAQVEEEQSAEDSN